MSVKNVEGNIPMSDNERAYREYLLAEKMRKLKDIIDRDTFFESLDAELDERAVEWNNEEKNQGLKFQDWFKKGVLL